LELIQFNGLTPISWIQKVKMSAQERIDGTVRVKTILLKGYRYPEKVAIAAIEIEMRASNCG
jgi:hypothetical protein